MYDYLPICIVLYYIVSHVCWCQGGQKREWDSLELELSMVVSHWVGTSNWIQVLCKSSRCFKLLNHLYSPATLYLKGIKAFKHLFIIESLSVGFLLNSLSCSCSLMGSWDYRHAFYARNLKVCAVFLLLFLFWWWWKLNTRPFSWEVNAGTPEPYH